ncbi:MAG: DNA modification methylase [Magnetococcales bacterium]|nr:DNA modification methylase [Nitrospirota bacterium]
MKKKIISICCQGSRYLSHTDMVQFQGNLKTLSESNLKKLKASILKYGWVAPVFIWNDKQIIDGHGRLIALQSLLEEGYTISDLPVVDIQAKTEKQAAEILLSINSQYNTMTNDGLTEFCNQFGLDFNHLSFAYELPTIDYNQVIPDNVKVNNVGQEDVVPDTEDSTVEVIIQHGDVYDLGLHRIMCGDSRDVSLRELLLNGKDIGLILTDPPYGINIVGKDGKVGGGIKKAPSTKHKPVIGDDKHFDPAHLLSYVCKKILFGANYYIEHLLSSPCWLVWVKNNGETDFADCELAWTDFDKPAKVYEHTWNGMVRSGNHKNEGATRIHPTQKPVGLLAAILDDFSSKGDIVADFYLGSGSTLIACEKTGRICYGMEIDPEYVDMIITRWCNYTNTTEIKRNGETMTWPLKR